MNQDPPSQTTLGSDVFVSYASQDIAVANSVVAGLEQLGHRCWMAPRDVKPGAQYADAIVRAINEATALVLVMSASAMMSSHVRKEVERASSKQKQIIGFRIDGAPLNPALEYFLSESHWIDVPALGLQAAVAKLADALGGPRRRMLRRFQQSMFWLRRIDRENSQGPASSYRPIGQWLGSRRPRSRRPSPSRQFFTGGCRARFPIIPSAIPWRRPKSCA
jgi:TIR domain